MFALLFGCCVLVLSGLIGFIMDTHFHITTSAFYWLLGIWSGVLTKTIIDKGANSK